MIYVLRDVLDVLFATLWQDAIIALCAALVLHALGKRLNAATRHVVLQTVLIAAIAVPVASTLPHLAVGSVTQSGSGSVVSGAATSVDHGSNAFGLRSIGIVLPDWAVAGICALWLSAVMFFMLRIALGIAQLSRFIRGSERLADRGGASVYASASVPVPIAFGLLRPAIVVPAAIVRSGGEELECVMLHELAHVRRRDAWMHIFERVVHAVLFFNPAIVLLLQSIALEREAACDDWALAHSRDASTYTVSLAALAVRTGIAADAPVACAAMGHEIVDRIERLQDRRRNRSLLLSPVAIGGFVFVLISVALSLQLLAPAIAFSAQPHVSARVAVTSDCTQPPSMSYPVPPPAPLPAGVATVSVSVSATGAVTAARIVRSSGNAILDRAALKTAKESGYEPAMQKCKPAAGVYLYKLTSTGAKS